ncbi:MAG: type VI secretion system contractile sheath large subunit [Phycisphaerae bacterium]|jgi:type VI secretion system ImpC/EvpB family protein
MSSDDNADVTMSSDASTPETPPRPPYCLVHIADFAAGDRLAQLTPVDCDNFSDVLRQARPEVAVALKPPLGDGSDWEFRLTFDSMASFMPAGLLAQIPAAKTRLDFWQKLRERRQGRIDEAALTAAIEAAIQADGSLAWLHAAPSAPGAAPAAPADGSILDLVDAPDESRRVSADVERLAADTEQGSARIGGGEAGRLNAWQQRLTLELTTIANAVLQHPDVRRIETAWRGLKLLVDRIDFREGVKLSVLSAPDDELATRLNEGVIEPAFAGDIPTPGMILCDRAYENTPMDLALLDELGRAAASLPAPLVFPMSVAFFGVKSARLLKNLPNLSGLIDGWQFAKWRSLREQPHARWLVGVAGRFLLRGLHAATPDAQTFTCAEQVSAASQLAWAGGHLAMGVAAARAFARHGWPTRMFGAEAGKLDDLPIVPNPADAQHPWGPGDMVLPDRRVDELPAIGLNLLQSMPGKDFCLLLGGMTVARPMPTAEIGAQQAALEVSLSYQQFSSAVGAWLCEQVPTLRGLDGEEVQRRLLFGLRDLVGLKEDDAEDALLVGVGPAPDDPGRTLVQVRITPPGRIVPGGLHVDFGFPLSS